MSTLRVTGLKQETSSATNISMAVGGGVTVAGIATFHNNAIFTNDVTVTGNISVGGTLTYQDVTDVDSIGIITARSGLNVTGGDVNIGSSTNGHGLLNLSQSALAAFNALVIQQGNTGFTANDGLQIGIDAGVHAYIKQYENRDIYLTTGATNTEKLRITSAGLVGIGTDNPDRLLHLQAASSTAYSGGDDSADYNFLKIQNTTDDRSAGIFFQIGSNGEAAITATEASDGVTDIAFQNRGGGVRSEKMRLDGSGNIKLNSDSPFLYLSDNNNNWIRGSSGLNQIRFGTNNIERMRITSAGELLHYGSSSDPGGATVTKKETVSGNGTLDLQIPGVSYIGHLYVMSIYAVNASVRTSRIYFITGRYGNSTVVTQLQTDDGSNGGRTFSIADVSAGVSNIIRFTDTSTTSNIVSMHFVGAIGS